MESRTTPRPGWQSEMRLSAVVVALGTFPIFTVKPTASPLLRTLLRFGKRSLQKKFAGNLTAWVVFRLEDVRETEGEKQN